MSIESGYAIGCIGRITELHADFYSKLVGFDLPFEAKVARELAQFCENLDAKRDGLWLATMNGIVHGSIVIDGSQADTDGAHLRWFITSDALRGQGMGSKLITQALDFCDAKGYKRVYLWTFDGLGAARHLYEKHGFQLAHEQVGTMWGGEVREQRFIRISAS
jgi:GNAT superfamily N-acetyltransferase